MSKFQKGDRVKVVINELYPSTVGKIGTITRSQQGWDGKQSVDLYKVRLDGHSGAMFGYADDDCLELI